MTQKVFENITLHVDPDKVRRPGKLFVRSGSLPSNTAIQDYDVGTFIFAAAGTPAEIVGSVYVNYDLILSVPQPYQFDALSALSIDQTIPVPLPVTNLFDYQTSNTYQSYNLARTSADLVVNRLSNML